MTTEKRPILLNATQSCAYDVGDQETTRDA